MLFIVFGLFTHYSFSHTWRVVAGRNQFLASTLQKEFAIKEIAVRNTFRISSNELVIVMYYLQRKIPKNVIRAREVIKQKNPIEFKGHVLFITQKLSI